MTSVASLVDVADRDDAAVGDADVGDHARCPGAVDHGRALDDLVEHWVPRSPVPKVRPHELAKKSDGASDCSLGAPGPTRADTTRGTAMADWQQHEWKLLIGGELVAGEAGTAPIVNPATEEVVAEAPEASVAQAEEAARAAEEAFPAWSATPAAERAELLKAAASGLEQLGPDLVPLIISETGATATVGSRMQVPVALERFHRYARDAVKSIGIPMPPQPVQATPLAPGGLMGAFVNRQPVGAVACISPYNFPLTNMVGKIAPALAVGCTVVMKPAPQDPLAIIVLAEVLREVGFPPGVVNLVTSVGTRSRRRAEHEP